MARFEQMPFLNIKTMYLGRRSAVPLSKLKLNIPPCRRPATHCVESETRQSRRHYLDDSSALPISGRPYEYSFVILRSKGTWEPNEMVPVPNSQLWNSQYSIVRK
ncbi:unnamed protein product [Somion occarium]|uniref:Uncharacterized protein n=1 Tax=Somion occarium TaxID=3059160 RepID=A0ABP1CUQ6_9APHY